MLGRRDVDNPGTIGSDNDRSKNLFGLVKGAIDGVRIGYITFKGDCRAPQSANQPDCLIKARAGPEIQAGDICAGLGIGYGNRLTKAAARTGDEGLLSVRSNWFTKLLPKSA